MQRILIVDPCTDTVESLSYLLRWWGHEVCSAAAGPTALEIAAIYQPTVVLMELRLPGLNGYEVARRLRQRAEMDESLLVAVSGCAAADCPQRCREAGFDGHLLKPVDPEHLRCLLEACSVVLTPEAVVSYA